MTVSNLIPNRLTSVTSGDLLIQRFSITVTLQSKSFYNYSLLAYIVTVECLNLLQRGIFSYVLGSLQ